MHIPDQLERALGAAVAHHLGAELGERGLLIGADRLASAKRDAGQRGARLLTATLNACYPMIRETGADVTIDLGSERSATRLHGALAFGAVTADVLTPRDCLQGRPADLIALACAMLNVGVGLVDGLCDADAARGARLLEAIRCQDLRAAAEEQRARGWLCARLPPALAAVTTVKFAAELIEAFFATLHAAHPGDARLALRSRAGGQLQAALAAEQASIAGRAVESSPEELIECSRRTSVLPFQIIETIAGGYAADDERAAGTRLGEAMWRIDDLVDLCDDARSGALNSVLLGAVAEVAPVEGERTFLDALERLLASTEIAAAASQAAHCLRGGLRLAVGCDGSIDDDPPAASFLHFVQRYAGIAPRVAS